MDRRRYARMDCGLQILVRRPLGRLSLQASCTQVSLGGAGFSLPNRSLPVGERVELRLAAWLPALRARVRWSTRGSFGVCFEASLSEILESWVGDYLESRDPAMMDLLSPVAV